MELYISDLDGTLLNGDKEISEYTRNTLNTLIASGINFSVATARTAASTVKILAGLDINIPVVLMNGVIVYDIKKAEYLKVEALDESTAWNVAGILKENKVTGFMYSIHDNMMKTYYENLDSKVLRDFHDERVERYYKSFEKTDSFFEAIKDNQIIYFTLVDEHDRLTDVLSEVDKVPGIEFSFYRDIYQENLWYLKIYSHKASKFNAVKYLREHYHYNRIIGFGDNLNDIPLFKACNEGYAVLNAVGELKKKAAGIIESNISDGVARFIYDRENKPDKLMSGLME
ncbi:MAG: Cof-type HAD-IIB family hydrolase [Bacillota bacterium]|nr:Cof-type HAD-IIB family hydrolase [Bacillota bacterium]